MTVPDAVPDPVPDPGTIARLRLVVARLYRQLAQASDRGDVTLSQLSALAKLQEHGPLRLGELAAREKVAGPSMIRTVGALHSAGLLAREPDPTDGRSCLLSITPAGAELLDRVRRDRSELLSRRAAGLDERRLADAVEVLELLLAEGSDNPSGRG